MDKDTWLIHREPIPPERWWQEALTNYYKRCRARRVSDMVIIEHHYQITSFLDFLLGKYPTLPLPSEITEKIIMAFLEDAIRQSGLSLAHESHDTLSDFFESMLADGILAASPIEAANQALLHCHSVSEWS